LELLLLEQMELFGEGFEGRRNAREEGEEKVIVHRG